MDDWVHSPKGANIFLGIEKGYFAAEGIDLDFPDGHGSANNLQLLGSKKILFATADSATAAQFITQGVNAKIVWGFLQTSPISIIYRKGLGIRGPKDLEGKKIGRAPAGAGEILFPALAARNGVNLSSIVFVNVTPAARNTALLNGDVHAIIGFFPDNVPFLRSKGANVDFIRYADYKMNTLGTGVAVNGSVITEKADTLRRLLRAITRSTAYTLTHRDEAIAAMKKRSPLSMKNPKVGREVLDNFLSLLHTQNTQGKPLGWMAKEDWEETLSILQQYGNLKNLLPVGRYYTNDFVPSGG